MCATPGRRGTGRQGERAAGASSSSKNTRPPLRNRKMHLRFLFPSVALRILLVTKTRSIFRFLDRTSNVFLRKMDAPLPPEFENCPGCSIVLHGMLNIFQDAPLPPGLEDRPGCSIAQHGVLNTIRGAAAARCFFENRLISF